MDHSATVCGARRLRAWLAAPLAAVGDVAARQDVVAFLLRGADGGCVEGLLRECGKVGDVEATMGKLYAKRCGVLEYIRVLRMARSVCLLAKEAKASATAPLPALLDQQLSLCSSSVIEEFLSTHAAELHSTATNPLDFFTEKGVAVPQRLQDLMRARDHALAALADELERVKHVLQLPGLEYRSIGGTPFLLDIPSSKTGRAEADWLVLTRTKTNVRYHTPVIIEQNTALCAARERLVAGANEEWEQKQHELATNDAVKEALGGLIDAVATLDALRSLSITSGGAGYVRPRMTAADSAEAVVSIKGARHPVLDRLLPGGYVGCDVQLAAGGTWLLTGPNMGGKSAFMRMIGLLAVMAQMGCYLPAASAQLPVFSGVYCRMGASDSILEGSSTFLTEMDETNRILRADGLSSALVLMDELGRGTSSFDGAAVAAATLEHLLRVRATVLFVTHYSYICEPYAQRAHGRVACYYMGFEEKEVRGEDGKTEKKLIFTYQPCRGITPSSFGVEVAQLAGLPACVTEEARRLSAEGEREQVQRLSALRVKQFLHGASK
ncbi:DNA mismatch repair protein MSH3 [Strigomonas culicis]|uniref:DNA mismatch repair protein MSH3 n=1 Tax=Strigomonas culicis TaxID=28005 RepID=S9TYS6_9TRYP|nr:DNA mismatch repair protein MSH3 [Strigomonas culicis]|eukprot:EPY23662.1 DNA mismatch repair protein MSH3 [Strigomonas culicis]